VADTGKWICDPFRLNTMRSCLVYSVGSKNRFDFERGILGVRPDCEIHTFDPTSLPPGARDSAAAQINFHQIGMGGINGVLSLGGGCGDHCPVQTLTSLIRDLQHEDRVIDILKVDIEGSEYDALIDLLYTCTFPINVRQLQIELHTKGLLNFNVQRLMLGLAHAGYTIFHKEANTLIHGSCYEFSFVRTAL
jgi:hypothetical protein